MIKIRRPAGRIRALLQLPSALGLRLDTHLQSYADFGALGLGFRDAAATHTIGVSLRMPVFDSGRRESQRAEGLAVLRQVAEESLGVATEELEQAHRRLAAGVTSNLEVIEAQARLARGRDNRAEAIAAYLQARIDLSGATGTVRSLVP